jgi:hypothetical protein
MSAQILRLRKEVRAMFWPWCVVVLARIISHPGVVGPPAMMTSGLTRAFLDILGGGTFWIGMPLLAVVPLGMEFQYRTELLLFSQPVSRNGIWREKWVVMVGAIVSSAAVYSIGPGPFTGLTGFLIAASWIAITICSATFWVLTAGSILGAVTLSLLQGYTMVALWQLIKVIFKLPELFLWESRMALLVVAVITLGYAAVMLVLSHRKLMHFQVTGGLAAEALLGRGKAQDGYFGRMLQCRATGVVLNLVRKELRLLFPAWSLMILCFVGEVLLAALQFMPGLSKSLIPTLVAVNILALGGLGTILAGSMSMGEERSLGTQSGNMTLPISAGLQWAIKLTVVIIGSFLGLLSSIAFGEFAFGEPFIKLFPPDLANHGIWFLFLITATLCFSAFWSACLSSNTVRAVLLLFPAYGVIGTAFSFGLTVPMALWRTEFLNWVIAKVHPFPPGSWAWVFWIGTQRLIPLSFFVPLLVLGLIQSYRLFRTESVGNFGSIARRLTPALIVAFAAGCVVQLPGAVVGTISEQTAGVLREVSQTIHTMGIDTDRLDAAHPLQLTLQDLARNALVSDRLRSWVDDRPITITPKTITLWGVGKDGRPNSETYRYFATVHFRNDWTCWTVESSFRSFFNTSGCTSPDRTWGSPMPQ